MCRLNLRVCVFLKAFCGKNLTPIPHQQTAPRSLFFFFFLFPPSLPHYVLFTPLEAARLSPSPPPPPRLFLLFRRPALTWLQHASLHPTAVFILPAFARIPLRESSLCLERRKKTVMSRTPPAGGPDGSQRFRTEQRDATHSKFRGCSVA